MPTGYTAVLLDKPETSFREFALQCARAFGACIMMRDDPFDAPIPDEFKPSAFYLEHLQKAEARVRELEVMTLEEAQRQAAKAYEESDRQYRDWVAKTASENATLAAMLLKVEEWIPPTPDHEGMKKFMREQLTISMSDPPGEEWRPKEMTAAEWLNEERQRAARGVARAAESWKEECERAEKRTRWVRDLRASLVQSEEPNGT